MEPYLKGATSSGHVGAILNELFNGVDMPAQEDTSAQDPTPGQEAEAVPQSAQVGDTLLPGHAPRQGRRSRDSEGHQ